MQEHTDVPDFLNNDRFVQWVLFGKYQTEWQEYQTQHPEQASVMASARQLILEIYEAEKRSLPALNQDITWENIRESIREQSAVSSTGPVRRFWQRPLLRAAAAVALLLGTWLLWTHLPSEAVTYQELVAGLENTNPLIELVNEQDSAREIVLEDGSRIVLKKNSRLSYPSHFEKDKRAVILIGEAFFEVAKDANRPFYIYANEMVTKVLGTSFRIRAFEEDQQVVVQVHTGRVSVYRHQRLNLKDPETTGLVLQPNQEAIYVRKTENLSRRIIEVPLPVPSPRRQAFPVRYDEAPVSQVLNDLEKRYEIPILFNEEVLDHCYITTALGDDPLYDQLDLICKTIGATYKEVDAQLIVESKGCK